MNLKYVLKRCEHLNEILAERLSPIFRAPVPANAYVCSRVTTPDGPDTGPSLSWFNRVIPIAIHEDGTNQIDADEEFQAVEASYRVWEKLESVSDTCPGAVEGATDIRFDFGAAGEIRTTSSRSIGYNYLAPDTNENIVVFWDEDWPHTSLGGVIALTTTTHIPQDGRIMMQISSSMPPTSSSQPSRTPTATAQRPI